MDKLINFLKKHSFYVILVGCLAVLGVVAVATGGNKAEESTKKPVATNVETEDAKTGNEIIEGAELVKEEAKEENKQEKAKEEESKKTTVKEDDSVATNAKPKSEIINPIKDGLVTRKFNIEPRLEKDGKVANVYKGIDIEAIKGSDVLAIADGEIIEAQSGDSREGNYVKVKHSNGLIVMYGNLEAKLNVKVGDKVSQGAVLGKTGNSIKVSPADRKSKEYLLIHVEKDREPIDPLTIFKELKVKE
ncbi:M23 family metallopeptidase [uncultured Clostridium sp.]|jgi:murein DD-endopeptidase MepM/ murein hydrolase activator NlpD|uniref:M23 family metallopeptidase n=1 Tax=uncultured Clostridium sp. TaxID=59620 RepID=UPI0026329AD7|nr:M23 family metallopeptidase [uncultured Clostridium sp.]